MAHSLKRDAKRNRMDKDLFNEFKQELKTLGQKMNRVYEDLSNRELNTDGFPARADLYETNTSFILEADLPGVRKDQIKLQLRDGQLLLSGKREPNPEMAEQREIFTERRFGPFSRTFLIPAPVSAENIKASFEQGILTVTLTKLTHTTENVTIE